MRPLRARLDASVTRRGRPVRRRAVDGREITLSAKYGDSLAEPPEQDGYS
jgi:hypothetical protein